MTKQKRCLMAQNTLGVVGTLGKFLANPMQETLFTMFECLHGSRILGKFLVDMTLRVVIVLTVKY